MASPQLENGYTKIANELYDAIIRWRFSSYEFRVIIFLIRKTYGWQKKTDWISLSQFVEGTNIQRTHICRTLNLLEQQNVITKGGNRHKPIYGINKDYELWKALPKGVRSHHSVKGGNSGSVKGGNLLVLKGAHTKDTITKETNTKDRYSIPPTIEMIKMYCAERKNKIDPQYFFDRNEATNWMYGKTKMKDWQAAIRTWERNQEKWDLEKNKPQTKKQEAIDLVNQCETEYGFEHGSEIAMFRFSKKYGKEEVLKYKGIFKL